MCIVQTANNIWYYMYNLYKGHGERKYNSVAKFSALIGNGGGRLTGIISI